MSKQSYLVTGAAGFIASNVARQLLDAGHSVVGLDNMNDAYDARLKEWRLAQLKEQINFRFERGDISDIDFVERAFENGRFDGVYNLAARAGVRQSMKNPWAYVETNMTGTLNVLEACRRHDVPRMVLASTSSLYGAHNPRPFREDADTARPLSPYAASKKGAESMAASYSHLYGIHTPILRYFTVYGPAGRPDMSVYRFVEAINKGTPLVLYGDGTQERDFTYVEDIARGTIAASAVNGHEVFNLGGDRPHSILELIANLEKVIGKQARIERRPAHRADVQATWASIDRARMKLKWAPTIPLLEGLRCTVEWHKENATFVATLQTQGDGEPPEDTRTSKPGGE